MRVYDTTAKSNLKRTFDLLDHLHYRGRHPVLAKRSQGVWTYYSLKEYRTIVNQLSLGMLEAGIGRGTRVATILSNSPEWNFIDMALAQVGALHVPVSASTSESNYQFIFNNAEVEYAFVSNEAYLFRIRKALTNNKCLKKVYTTETINEMDNWNDLVALGKESERQEELNRIKNSISEDDNVVLIYTSGTTGFPKGVLLTHKNIVSNFIETAALLKVDRTSRALSFLPLCHVLERVMNYSYQMCGDTIYYCENIDQLRDYLRDKKIEVFTTVPRILEKFSERVYLHARNFRGPRRFIVLSSLKLTQKYETDNKNLWLKLKLFLAKIVVFNRLRRFLGKGNKVIICGGAKLQENVCRLLWCCGIKVVEGYGMTETSPVIAVGGLRKGDVKIGKVGRVLNGVEVKISEEKEILVKGPNVTKGYYNRPDLDKIAFDEEGWFHTGDTGFIDEDGFLGITDRKREIFKSSGGKYISPLKIEMKLNNSPFINQSMVVGDQRKFASAIICPSYSYIESWCNLKGIEFPGIEECSNNTLILNRINQEIGTVNEQLDHAEQVRKFVIITDKWSINTGELSSTLKIKRKVIAEKYKNLIDQMYS